MKKDNIAENVIKRGKEGVKQNIIEALDEFCDDFADEMWEAAEEIITLRKGNAALKERLQKAVELPFDHKYADFHIEPYFGEIKPSLVDNGAKVVIPMYVYFKFNSVEEAKSWLIKQQTGGEQ